VASASTAITSPSGLGISLVNTLGQSCFGSSNGQATVAANGGIAPYAFTWNTSPVQTSATAVGLANGTYTASVTDASGCTAQINVPVMGPTAPLTNAITSVTDVLCFSGSTGAAEVNATGGTAPYSYSWNTSTPTIGNTLSGVTAGTYTVSVTDANGCSTTTNVTISQPAVEIFTYVESYQHESCFGANDGWVTLQTGGGSGSLSVEWNTTPVQYGPTATGLGVGFYTATVTDDNGCSVPKYFPVIVNGPSAPLTISTVTSDHDGLAISCPGGSDGSIDATVTGGTSPYQYTWTSGLGVIYNSQDIQSLSAGSYSLVSMDANGCTTSTTVILGEPSPIAVTASIITAACQSSSTGAIDISIVGGTAPYKVAWSGPNGFTAVQQDLTALAAGIYTVIVTDAHGCAATTYFDVTEPGLITLTGTTSIYNGGVNVSCYGSSDGSIDATIVGGVAPYTLVWNGPAGSTYTTEDIAGLVAGTYSLSVQDANGCASLTQFQLAQPAALTTQLQNTLFNGADLSCSNASDGVIDATVLGGTPAHGFAWSGPNGFISTNEDISGLTEGTYTLQTTDQNGCVSIASTTLSAPTPIAASAASPTFNSGSNVSCDGESDGSINVMLTGGTGIISTVWNGPNGFSSTDLTPNGLEAGTYTATFTDVNGCASTSTIILTAPAPTSLSASTSSFPSGTSVSCATANDGTIDLTVVGGAGNVSYQWTGPNAFTANTEDITGLIAGTYLVTTIDDNGCTAAQTYALTAPAPLMASETVVPAACFGSNTAAIDLAITGGTAPFNLLWSGPGAFSATTEDLTALYAGVYVANITDANGCALTYPITVTQANTFQVTATLSMYPGGFNVSCAGISNGSIELVTSGGTAPYYYQWIGPNGYSAFTEDIQALEAGSYNLILNDDNGCSTLFTYTLTGADPLATGLISQIFPGGANTGCTDSQDGEIDALVLGGIQPYQYSWTSDIGFAANTEDLTGLEPGTYQLTVTDALGCSTADSITLIGPVPVGGSATATILSNGSNVSCNNSTDGNIDLSISGGAQPYIVEWSGPQGFTSYQEDPSGVPAGTYDAVITDLNGCTTTASITLNAPAPVNIDLTASLYGNGFNLPCQGSSSGTLVAVVSGGSSNYGYAWSGPNGFSSTSDSLIGIAAGTYTLEVTDGVGCVATDTYTLTQPTGLDLVSVVSDAGYGYAVSCAGNDGSISITVNGGTMPYVFDWTGTNGFASLNEDLSGLASGSYQLNLIDANGCASTQTYVLSEPAELLGSTLVSGTVCDSATDGAIDLTVTGGVAPFNFSWIGTNGFVSSTEDINALPGGTYDVVITDAMSCLTTATATVLASSSIELSVYVSNYGNVNIPCLGDSAGVIELTIDGGSGTLDLLWAGPNGFTSTETQLSGLLAGTYQAIITDVNGCSADTTIVLTEPAGSLSGSLSAFVYPSGTNISCTGSSDGAIDATVIGGTSPYSFDWRGPDSTQFNTEDINGLQAGIYELVIVDANQCTYSSSITLSEPDSALAIDATISSFIGGYGTSCSGTSDGSINITSIGGNGNVAYSWSGPSGFTSTDANLDSLASGTYTLTVTDLNGCTIAEAFDITAPLPVSADLAPTLFPGGTTISCNGAADGSLTAVIYGGASGYSTQWTGPNGFSSSTLDISGLMAGSYCLIVVDTNGCSVQSCTDLIAPAQLGLSATTLDALCGGANGSVDLTVNGGTAPFMYAWDNGTNSEDLAAVLAASYTVQVTDVNGCTVDTIVVVNGSANLIASGQSTDNACSSGTDGTIDLSLLNGTAPFSYVWSNGATSEDLTGLTEDTYTVVVADANGCTWNGSFSIAAPLPISVDSLVFEYSNGYNLSAYGSDNGVITVTPSGGTAPYTYAWSNGANTASVNGLAAGTYTVLVTDANGCSVLLTFNLDQPSGLAMPTGFSPNGDGANDAYIVQGLDGFASNQLVVFNRWGNVVYERLNYKNDWNGENLQGELLPNGTYFVILRINEGSMTLQNYVDLRR
ncbi:MAG: gliding motility-associated C-terminal domain-containing protein, partial [Flavobacteriales bacterium]|nr:gliding motility-associated C-terminal domain-containing protein [Flavobacteriales bacterium]